MTGWMVGWLAGMAEWRLDGGWMVAGWWLDGWNVGWLAGWLDGWLDGWMAGWRLDDE